MNHDRILARLEPRVKSLGQNFLGPVPLSGPIEIIRTTVSGTRRDNCSFSDRLPPTDDFPPLCSFLFVRNWKSASVSVRHEYMFWDGSTLLRRLLESWGKGKRSLWNLEEWRIQLSEACIYLIRSWKRKWMVSDD